MTRDTERNPHKYFTEYRRAIRRAILERADRRVYELLIELELYDEWWQAHIDSAGTLLRRAIPWQ